MLYDHITISCHETVRSRHQMKAQGHQASFQATPRPARATASHPRANIRLRVRNRHLKSARKYAIPGRKRTLVKNDRKSFGGKLRMLSSYTFYRGFFKNPLRKLVFFSAILSNIRTTGISELRKTWTWGAVWGITLGCPWGAFG